MINTRCKFYYGHTVNDLNLFIDFKEGAGPELQAQIEIGEYSFTDFLVKIELALNTAGALNYVVTADRTTRIITITADGTFKLLPITGTQSSISAFGLMGFTSDTGLATSHSGNVASGSEWIPQFYAQDFSDFENNQSAIDGSIKESASGKVESVRFGTKKIMECNFKFITDTPQSSKSPFLNDESGVSNARTFLEYATTKADLEFMPDYSNANSFIKCHLESTPENSMGLGFKLKELYSQGLVGYYETGLLKFRKLD